MTRRVCRFLVIAALLAGLLTPATGCLSNNADTLSSLIDLTATSSGSLLEILVRAYLTSATEQQLPDLDASISDQQH
jgi:hypothetical protein